MSNTFNRSSNPAVSCFWCVATSTGGSSNQPESHSHLSFTVRARRFGGQVDERSTIHVQPHMDFPIGRLQCQPQLGHNSGLLGRLAERHRAAIKRRAQRYALPSRRRTVRQGVGQGGDRNFKL